MITSRYIIPAHEIEPRWLEGWAHLGPQPCEILGMSLFGDWFLARRDGHVWRLDLLEGSFESLGVSVPLFWSQLGTARAADEWLQVGHVLELETRGLGLVPGQCYTYKVPPRIGGTISVDNMLPGSLGGYQLFCSQLHRELDKLPEGVRVIGVDCDSEGTVSVRWRPEA